MDARAVFANFDFFCRGRRSFALRAGRLQPVRVGTRSVPRMFVVTNWHFWVGAACRAAQLSISNCCVNRQLNRVHFENWSKVLSPLPPIGWVMTSNRQPERGSFDPPPTPLPAGRGELGAGDSELLLVPKIASFSPFPAGRGVGGVGRESETNAPALGHPPDRIGSRAESHNSSSQRELGLVPPGKRHIFAFPITH